MVLILHFKKFNSSTKLGHMHPENFKKEQHSVGLGAVVSVSQCF